MGVTGGLAHSLLDHGAQLVKLLRTQEAKTALRFFALWDETGGVDGDLLVPDALAIRKAHDRFVSIEGCICLAMIGQSGLKVLRSECFCVSRP